MTRYGSNNTKGALIEEALKEFNVPYSRLGTGTNRLAVMIDEYAVKIALDADGKIDNKREFKYSKALQPYVVKAYEIDRVNGLILVTEYVKCFEESDFRSITRQSEMREILSDLSQNFLIGDVGITTKNFSNWGIRTDDNSICMLDFAYVYAISYQIFKCSCGALLKYDNDYVNLVCERCRKKYTFGAIRKKISKKQQAEEIGDITKIGYILNKPEQIVELKLELEPKLLEAEKERKKKEPDPKKIMLKKHRKESRKAGFYKRRMK